MLDVARLLGLGRCPRKQRRKRWVKKTLQRERFVWLSPLASSCNSGSVGSARVGMLALAPAHASGSRCLYRTEMIVCCRFAWGTPKMKARTVGRLCFDACWRRPRTVLSFIGAGTLPIGHALGPKGACLWQCLTWASAFKLLCAPSCRGWRSLIAFTIARCVFVNVCHLSRTA